MPVFIDFYSSAMEIRPGPFKFHVIQESAVSPFRHYDCENYDLCLNLAAALNWDSFACSGCNKEVNKNLYWQAKHAQMKDDVAGEICNIPEIPALEKKTEPAA